MRLKYSFSAIAVAALCWGCPLSSQAADPAPAATETTTTQSVPAATETSATQSAPAATDTPRTTDEAPSGDALAPVKDKLVSPQQEKVTTELKPKNESFTFLKSDDPEDYKRKSGFWISDSGNGRIVYMRDFKGNDFYSLGNAGRDIGQFLNPQQVWVDIEGKLYIADRDNNRIVRTDDVRGYNWTEKTGLNHPRGVAQHGRRLIISDTGNDRILIYNKFEDETPMVTLKDEKIKDPGYLWVDEEGNIFVSCGDYPPGGRVVRIPFDLTVESKDWQVYEGKGLRGSTFAPTQVCVTETGLFMTDTVSQRIVRLNDIGGRLVSEGGSYGSGNMQFLDPKGIAEDETGALYIVDSHNDRIVRLENVRGKGWQVYESSNAMFGLRSPQSIYVWSPRPTLEELEDRENSEKDNKDDKGKNKEKGDNGDKPDDTKFVTNPDGNGSGFAL